MQRRSRRQHGGYCRRRLGSLHWRSAAVYSQRSFRHGARTGLTSLPFSPKGEPMKRLLTQLLGLLLLPAAAAWCFTSEAQANNPLPSACDYSAMVLPERSDTLSWKVLGQVEPVNANGK